MLAANLGQGGDWQHSNICLSRHLLATHLMRTENHFELLQEPIGQLVPPQRGQELLHCLVGLSTDVPGAAQQHGHQGTVVLPANRHTESAREAALQTRVQRCVPAPSPPPRVTAGLWGQTGIGDSKCRVRTELCFQAAAVRDPRAGAPSAAALCTWLGERQIFKKTWDFGRKQIFLYLKINEQQAGHIKIAPQSEPLHNLLIEATDKCNSDVPRLGTEPWFHWNVVSWIPGQFSWPLCVTYFGLQSKL